MRSGPDSADHPNGNRRYSDEGHSVRKRDKFFGNGAIETGVFKASRQTRTANRAFYFLSLGSALCTIPRLPGEESPCPLISRNRDA